MSLLDRAEKKFGHLAIPRLIHLVVALSVVVFVMFKLRPESIGFWLLDRERVMHGEVWRLVTYIFIPQFGGIFGDYVSLLFYVFFQIWIADGLEREWGSFRLNVYFLLGMIGTTTAAFFFGSAFSNGMLFNSLFFAFARYHGDHVINLMLVLPVKIKWLAWADAVFLVVTIFIGSMEARMTILLGFANYLVFFGRDIIADARMRGEVRARRATFQAAHQSDGTLHRCKACGKTEVSDPHLDFRVAADGEEYCGEHLPGRGAK